jgi:hypothetical protein
MNECDGAPKQLEGRIDPPAPGDFQKTAKALVVVVSEAGLFASVKCSGKSQGPIGSPGTWDTCDNMSYC